MTIFFSSDHHFNHRNVIRYCARPFPDIDAMNAALIERWNARVGDEDVVYHLGDFTLAGVGVARAMFSRLRGRIKVLGLPWHHDKGWVPKHPGPSQYSSASGHEVEILPPMLVERFVVPGVEGKFSVSLSHYPLAEWDAGHHGAWHLHGHSHGNHVEAERRKLDVGVDCHGYAPISLAEVHARMSAIPKPSFAPDR